MNKIINYEIKLINVTKGNAEILVTAPDDSTETINVAKLPTNTDETDVFIEAVTKYIKAYLRGKELEKASEVSPEVNGLVGKSKTITI